MVAACLRLDLNPGAPQVVLCGDGVQIRQAGDRLAHPTQAIPVFIPQARHRWTYQGLFKGTGSWTEPAAGAPQVAGSGRALAEISRVILLEAV